MRVLIVGAGVAGLTLAAELLQQGRTPTVVERAPAFTDAGYSLGIYPLGSGVLHGLGKYDELLDRGEVARTYKVLDGRGQLVQDVDLSSITEQIGPMVLISRTDLIDILCDAARGADVRFGTTVTDLSQDDRSVTATLSDGSTGEYDVVIATDGIKSELRQAHFGDPDVFDTNWTLWAWWAPLPDWDRDANVESWGHGRFFGLYPTTKRIMVCMGMPNAHLTVDPSDLDAGKAFMHEQFRELVEGDPRTGEAIDQAEALFSWPMSDARSHEWVDGRVGLCGDAAVGFMPTAGAGANSAMHTAGSLADELSRVDGEHAHLALELFEKRCRHIVEANQKDSRKLAKYIFVDHAATAWGRDQIMKHYPMTKMVGDIIDAMKTPF